MAMWPYWILFLIPAVVAAASQPVDTRREDGTHRAKFSASWLLVMISIALMIGFRDRVGGDWYAYVRHVLQAEMHTYKDALYMSDPAYQLLNVLSVDFGMGIVGVNLVCGLVFSIGLIVYVRSMPMPWLALAVAIPYMTVVVSMGYSRQGVALGLALISLVALGRQRLIWFLIWVFLAATFHRSAVILICIPLLSLNFRNFRNIPVLLFVSVLMYAALLEGQTDQFVEQYIESEMQSDGAFIRLLMNVVPALILIIYRKRFTVTKGELKVYSVMSFLAIVSFIALIGGILPSTALDRIGLYLLPLQLFVFSNLPNAFGQKQAGKKAVILWILFYYTMVLFVWLNFASFSRWWLPYRMFPPLDAEEAYQTFR